MELVSDRSTAALRPSVAAVYQQGMQTQEDSGNLQALDNETWRSHIGCRPSSANGDDTCARDDLGPEETDTTTGEEGKEQLGPQLGAWTSAGQFKNMAFDATPTRSSCDTDIWVRYRFRTGKWADDDDDLSDSVTLDGDTDCCSARPSSCSTATTSPCTTCASPPFCDDELTISEADAADDDYHGLMEECDSETHSLADLHAIACRPFHVRLAQRFVEHLSEQGVVPASVLDRGFYLALLGSLRVLERYGAELSEVDASLAYASVYLQGALGLAALPKREVAYQTVLAVSLAFSFISEVSISMGKWKKALEKDVECVAEKTVSEMSEDLMMMFKARGYLLRPSFGELRACGVANWSVEE